MGMLGLFRAWLDCRNEKSRARRRVGLLRAETLEYRRMLTPGVTGTTLEVDGTAAADTISVKQDAAGVTVMVNNVTNNYGPGITIHTINIFAMDGNDQITVNSVFSNTTVNVNGGNDTNTFIDTNQANTWKITGPNSGGINNNINFTNIQNLQSGDFNDSFKFGPNGYVAGTIDGGQGINLLDYSGRNVGVTVNLATSSATAIGGGFTNITDLKGSVDNTDVLTGLNTASTWNITGVSAGDVNSQFFYTGIENLVGGSSDDQFAFSPAGVERSIIGGLGNNILDYSARTAAVTTNLSLNASTAIGASFQQIGRIIGSSSGNDILTGYNQVNTWSIDGPDIGSVTNPYSSIRYQGYENLVGGNTSDSFQMSDSGVISGTLSGGGGLNKLDYSSRSAAILLNLATNSVTSVGGGYTAIQSFTGSKAVGDQIIGANSNTAWDISGSNSGDVNGTLFFASFENLYGGTQNDSFDFQGAGFLSGSIDGGQGVNTLDYSGRHNIAQSGIVVNLGNSTATAIGSGYLHISNFIGTPHLAPLPGQITRAPDTLVAPDTNNTWQITGADGGTVAQISFSGFENLTGGLGVDVFVMNSGGTVSGIVNGGPVPVSSPAGGNWLDYSSLTTAVTVNLAKFTATGVGQLASIQNVHGGNGTNTLTGDSRGNVLVGGDAADNVSAGSGRSLLIGGLGSDTVSGGAGQDIVIGAYTDYDHNLGALASILAEWQSANALQTRINHLRNGGGLNGNNVLVADITVHNDAVPDVIYGGAGPNWLWGGPSEFKDATSQDTTDTPTHNSILLSGSNTVTFNVQSFAVTIDPVITITTAANTKLASATIKLGANSNPAQDVLGFVASGATGNITGSFNQAKGLLTLTSTGSTATLAQWQAALRKVVFYNSSATPTTAPRTVYFQVSDGTFFSNNVTSTVNINYAPVLAGSSNLKYTTLQAATPINPNITVSDPNSQTLQSATVSISTYYQSNQDQLTFTGNASTGDIFASFDFTTGIMTLKSGGLPATLAQYQAALRLVSYVNSSSFPLTTTRTVSYQVNDGNANSNVVKSTITFS